MDDLSLHILDVAENSLRAGAKNITIKLIENKKENRLTLKLEDDGHGMDKRELENASDPFFTTKSGKRFGLGIPFLSQASEEAGGSLTVESEHEKGTRITATFNMNNIDMKPIGDIDKTMRVLKATHPEINFSFEHIIEIGSQP